MRLPTVVIRGEVLTSWLTITNCTRSQLAGKLEVSKGRISQLLTSEKEPSAHLIAKLLTLTELPFDRLFKIIHRAPRAPSTLSSAAIIPEPAAAVLSRAAAH